MAFLGLLGISFLSALVVAIPIEVALAAYIVLHPGESAFLIALATAATHIAGKLVHYWLGEEVIQRFTRRAVKRSEKWEARWNRLEELCERNPVLLAAVTFVSAFLSLPPFAAMPFFAGTVGMRWWSFALWSFLGRVARFWIVLAIPGLIPESWLHK